MAKKKTKEPTMTPEMSEPPTRDDVFVLNYGLEPSERHQKAIAERASAWAAATLNGWAQDREMKTADGRSVKLNVGRTDLSKSGSQWIPMTSLGHEAVKEARQRGEALADLWDKTHQAPIMVECDARKGHSDCATLRAGLTKISATHWDAITRHPHKGLQDAIKSGRILDPAKTEEALRSKDQGLLEDIIIRTQCKDGLALIHSRETARKNTRTRVIVACDRQGKRLGLDFEGARSKTA